MKRFIKGAIVVLISLSITTTTVLLFNIIKYPLSKQDVINEIESKKIIDSKEEHGAWAYIVDIGNNIYLCHTVSESIFLNRYKHDGKFEYNENKGVVSTAVPGKYNIYIMDFDGVSIRFIQTENSRLRILQILLLISVNIPISSLIIQFTHTNFFIKLRKKWNQAYEDNVRSSG